MFLKSIIICSIISLVQSTSCKHLLAQLANAQMLFVHCVTENSVPVTMCKNCIEQYQHLLQQYDYLLVNCSDTYFDKDRLNLIASTEFVLTGLWSKAYCDDCSNNNNSIAFGERSTLFYDCLNKYKTDPCENCKLQYLDLNNFFITLDQHNNGEVCYDLQDSMNRTRNKWSKELNCCRREQNLTLFMIVLAITSCLPLLFYGTTFCITKRQERHERVLYNEDPYNSEVPSSSHQNNITETNNPSPPLLDILPTSSNADASVNPAASTSMKSNDIKQLNSNKYMENSDDELLLNLTNTSQEKIQSSSNTDTTIKPVASTSMKPNHTNQLNSNKDMESSDDELLLNITIPSQEKIKYT